VTVSRLIRPLVAAVAVTALLIAGANAGPTAPAPAPPAPTARPGQAAGTPGAALKG